MELSLGVRPHSVLSFVILFLLERCLILKGFVKLSTYILISSLFFKGELVLYLPCFSNNFKIFFVLDF